MLLFPSLHFFSVHHPPPRCPMAVPPSPMCNPSPWSGLGIMHRFLLCVVKMYHVCAELQLYCVQCSMCCEKNQCTMLVKPICQIPRDFRGITHTSFCGKEMMVRCLVMSAAQQSSSLIWFNTCYCIICWNNIGVLIGMKVCRVVYAAGLVVLTCDPQQQALGCSRA